MTLVSTTHISQWDDQSGSGNNGTQGTDANRMIYNTSGGPGNLPYVAFGTNQFVSLPDLSALSGGEIFVVRKVGADPPASLDGSFYKFGTAGSSDHVPFTDGNVYDGFGSNVRKTQGNPTPSLANWHIWNVTSISGEYTSRINGTQFFTTGSNTVGFSATPLFGKGVANSSDGGATTVWLFNGKLSTADRIAMNSWLNIEWQLGLNI